MLKNNFSERKKEGHDEDFQALMDKIKLIYDKQCLANQSATTDINIYCITKQLIEALDGVKKETSLVKQGIIELNGLNLNIKEKNSLRLSPVRLYTSKEVCQILMISERTLRYLRKKRSILFIRQGHFVRFTAKHINDFINQKETEKQVLAPPQL